MNDISILKECKRKGFRAIQLDDESCLGLLQLENDIYDLLLNKGFLTNNDLKSDSESLERVRSGINLVYPVEAQIDPWDTEPPENLDDFFKSMYLTQYKEEEGVLKIICEENLYTLILHNSSKFILNKKNTGLNVCHGIKIRQNTYSYIESKLNISGMCHVCDFQHGGMVCAESYCYSEFCWKVDGQYLIYFSGGAESVFSLWIYPDITFVKKL